MIVSAAPWIPTSDLGAIGTLRVLMRDVRGEFMSKEFFRSRYLRRALARAPKRGQRLLDLRPLSAFDGGEGEWG